MKMRYQYYKHADGEWVVRDERRATTQPHNAAEMLGIIARCPTVEKACLIRDCLNDDWTRTLAPTRHTNHFG